MKTSILAFATLASTLLAAPPEPGTDLRKTLSAASQQNKLGFVLLGRPACGNCNATKAMIKEGKIPVTDEQFVMADLNIDDPKTQAEFMRKYGKEKFGNMLPFVVVTDSKGKALASSGGYKSAEQWSTLLASVQSQPKTGGAGAAGGAPGASGGAAWPFKTAVPK